jgi:hypothetical protein
MLIIRNGNNVLKKKMPLNKLLTDKNIIHFYISKKKKKKKNDGIKESNNGTYKEYRLKYLSFASCITICPLLWKTEALEMTN